MKRKLPILTSTLTLLVSMLSVMPVGAASETGPWSFDELMAAKNEVDAEASVQCTDSFTRAACVNRIMESKGGIYYAGLWKFKYIQFTPLSMNFATGELNYYYNSTNEYRKNNNKRPYLKDYLTRLFIVQVEQGYDNWSADLRSGIKENEHWQILFDSEVTGEGASLLPYDQKSSVLIDTPSFDAKYEKYLRVLFTKSFGDESEIVTYDFTECAEGRTCEAWYDTANPFLYFKDFDYSDGLSDGYAQGYQAGYEAGHSSGEQNGYSAGYEAGHVNGVQEGYNDGYEFGHLDGKNQGYDAGYGDGLNDGQTEGYQNGLNDGYQNGQIEGYADGYNAGHNIGTDEGYQNGYDAGYEAGRDDGYEAGYHNGYEAGSINNNETQSGSSVTNATEQSGGSTDEVLSGQENDQQNEGENNGNSNLSETSDFSKTGNNIISVPSATDNSFSSGNVVFTSTKNLSKTSQNTIASKSVPSSPDTGTITTEKGSSEFPWWIGVISIAAFMTFIWFFGPKHRNHKKSQKKS